MPDVTLLGLVSLKLFFGKDENKKIVHYIFSEYSQREQTIESPSSDKGTSNPSLAQFGQLVIPLIIVISRLIY